MTFDAVQLDRDLRHSREKRSFDLFQWVVLAALVAFSTYMFLWEFTFTSSDLYKHAVIASQFNFADPHSITSRLAYPLWHLFVAALFQLGVPLNWAAATVCALCKALAFLLVRRYLLVMTRGKLTSVLLTLCALFLMLVTPVRLESLNNGWVYRGVGSPTVWHNPTQLAVLVTAMLCVPYTLHCWYAFEGALPQQGDQTMLPWRKVAMLALLLLLSLAAKPTFMQALIPAAAVFFLAQWIRHPKNSRYFLQIIVAYLPAAGYFLLQYLYYTGVVVPFTSGVEFGVTLQGVWYAVRNMLLMTVFPLFVVIFCRRGSFKQDKMLVLSLLMVLFSVLEAMCFHETGVRENHGNFNWASMSSAFMLWVAVMPRFVDAIADYRADHARLQTSAAGDNLPAETLAKAHKGLSYRSFTFFVSFVLLMWHLYASLFYIYFLLSTGNTF